MKYKITVKNNLGQKYLFLDIDGVLNSFEDYNMTGEEFEKNIHKLSFVLSPNQINLLNKIVEEFNPKIILSSYWRTRYSTKKINKKFKKKNFIGKILDKTTNHCKVS